MKDNVEVSVVVPIYNVEKYLERCVNSIINQTFKNIEIILVDDGSTDSSGELCEEIKKRDNRIKVYHKKNGGLGSARNYGYKYANGEYILFLDSDDYIEINTIEEMIKYKEYDIVCCGFDRVNEETKKVYSEEMINFPFEELEINDKTIMDTAFLSPSGWGKLFKKELLKDIEFSSNKKAIEDILFYLEVIPKVKKIKYIKKVLWHYMVRKDSLIMGITEEKAQLFEENLLDVKAKYIEEEYNEARFNYLTLQVFIHNCISIPSRLFNNKDINIRNRLKHIKKYMNDNFPNWRKVKFKIKGQFVKNTAIHIIRLMYITNTFIVFLYLYNFLINKLKIDVKW